MIENVLRDELAAGKTYKSAADFYEQCIRGRSYFVMNNSASQQETDEARAKFAAVDLEEVKRLQNAYADRWAA